MCLAIPGKILDLEQDGENRLARVEFGGITRKVSLDLVPEAGVGDYVIVHVGFAISKMDEEEAMQTLQILREAGELWDESERRGQRQDVPPGAPPSDPS